MRQSTAWLAATAVLIAAVSFPAFSRGHSAGGRSHSFAGSRPAVTHVAPSRSHAGHPGFRTFVGAVAVAPLLMAAPRYYYSQPPVYVAPPPRPAYWYYCPALNAYYPYVQECPDPWQPVVPQPYDPGALYR